VHNALSNAIRASNKEVATFSPPPPPKVPPAGLPATGTVGAKTAVSARADRRRASGEEGSGGGDMGGATVHTYVAFFLAPHHPPATPTQSTSRKRE